MLSASLFFDDFHQTVPSAILRGHLQRADHFLADFGGRVVHYTDSSAVLSLWISLRFFFHRKVTRARKEEGNDNGLSPVP
jgi:hypothetical protein